VPAKCDLSEPEYGGFLARVRTFYRDGLFELADVERVSSFLTARDMLVSVCPAAVLQALLLKLEENMVYEPRAYEELMAEYARYFHAAILEGGITRGDLEAWPLGVGVERVLAMSRALSERQELTSALVMNFCSPRDRFGELQALNWLLEPPFGDPAASSSIGEDVGLLDQTDLFIYLVDAPWCTRPSELIVEQLRRAVRRVFLVPYTGGPEREEQTAYFKFITDHYDNLPDFTIFVHPDAPEHQGADFPALRRALKLIRTQSAFAQSAMGYYPLAHQILIDPKRAWGTNYAPAWRHFWARLFDKPWRDYAFRPPACRWDVHKHTFIHGLAEGAERQSRGEAKATCLKLDNCAGVTCGTSADPTDDSKSKFWSNSLGRATCTARSGAPSGLFESPEQETSYVQHCVDNGGTPHDNGRMDIGDDAEDIARKETQKVHTVGVRYSVHSGQFLADYAADDSTYRDISASKARCDEIGDSCAGITCDGGSGGAACSVRVGSQGLLPSPTGEVSHLKETVLGSGALTFPPPAVPPSVGASNLFQMYTGSQSVVHKDRIRVVSRETYAALGADGPFCSKYSGLFEAVWHVMFGEPLSQWPREQDPALPVYLKWGVPTIYSFGDESVI